MSAPDKQMIERVAAALYDARKLQEGATDWKDLARAAIRAAAITPPNGDEVREALERASAISITSFDGHCVRLDFETREEAETACDELIKIVGCAAALRAKAQEINDE